jgi:hypothetical protein
MKRFAEINGSTVTAVVDAEDSPGAAFVELPADQPCAPGYTFENGTFRPLVIPCGWGEAGRYG